MGKSYLLMTPFSSLLGYLIKNSSLFISVGEPIYRVPLEFDNHSSCYVDSFIMKVQLCLYPQQVFSNYSNFQL